MIYEVRLNGSKYCGPVSLSALTGHGTRYITEKIRDRYGLYRVRGMQTEWCVWYLVEHGLNCKRMAIKGRPNLRQWHEDYARKDETYLVGLTDHLVVIRNGMIVCTQFRGVPKCLAMSRYLRKRVLSVHIISGLAVPEIKKYLRDDPYYVRAKSLIKHFGIDLDIEGGDGCLAYWIYWPEEMIDSKFGGVDPFDDDHFADSWEEVVNKIEYVARDFSLPLP